MTTEMKNTRWTKIRTAEDDTATKNNVLYITVERDRCHAEATFTSTPHYAKASYWLLHFLQHAGLDELYQKVKAPIQTEVAAASKNSPMVMVIGEGWDCGIQKLEKGVFNAQMNWLLPAAEESPEKGETSAEEPQVSAEEPAAEEISVSVEEPAAVEETPAAEEPPVTGGTPESEESKPAKKSKKKGGKPLTYEKLRVLAKKCYMEGGDTVYECWSEDDFNKYVEECGPMTKANALDLFHTLQAQYGCRTLI